MLNHPVTDNQLKTLCYVASWPLFTELKGCETKICSCGDGIRFEWLSDKEAGFFFGRTEAWLCSFRWTFTRLPQCRVSPVPVSYETQGADAQCRLALIGRSVFLAAAAAAAVASRRSRLVVGRVHVSLYQVSMGLVQSVCFSPSLTQYELLGRRMKHGRHQQTTLSALFYI